jgi:hypothetical protein
MNGIERRTFIKALLISFLPRRQTGILPAKFNFRWFLPPGYIVGKV